MVSSIDWLADHHFPQQTGRVRAYHHSQSDPTGRYGIRGRCDLQPLSASSRPWLAMPPAGVLILKWVEGLSHGENLVGRDITVRHFVRDPTTLK